MSTTASAPQRLRKMATHPSVQFFSASQAKQYAVSRAWCWIAAQMLALWPSAVWMTKRMSDGSDDPLGLLAFGILGLLLWQHRHELCSTPNRFCLLSSLTLTLTATLAQARLPALLYSLLAMLALAVTLLDFLPSRVAKMPVMMLAVLALPIMSSLQFYAGYPLRVITAEVSQWLLSLFYQVNREGCTLLIEGRLVMVDAPCSGVQMAWLGYFCAATMALWQQLRNQQFLLRLPFVGLLILCGNILRNSVLVALQASSLGVPEWLHQGVGIFFLSLVCIVILRLMAFPAKPATCARQTSPTHFITQKTKGNASRLFYISNVIFFACALWSAHLAWATPAQLQSQTVFVEWPHLWEGRILRPLALGHVEQRFANGFPGAISRMTDGQRIFIFRHILGPTRKLHPAIDCYQGLGYQISQIELRKNGSDQSLWRSFLATRNGQMLRVYEQIKDARGQTYTDTSAWYWSAILNPENAPWQAITIAEVLQ